MTIRKIFGRDLYIFNSNKEMDLMFVKAQVNQIRDMYQFRGFVLLSEVYEMFTFPLTRESLTMGWCTHKTEEINILFNMLDTKEGEIELIFKDLVDISDFFEKEKDLE